MSRIGKLPVEVPGNVKAEIKGATLRVEGPKGKLEKEFSGVEIAMEGGTITVTPAGKSRHCRAMYGTARSIIANMVEGVAKGYTKDLIINGVGFRATVEGKVIDLALGYSHPIKYPIPAGVTVTVADNTKVNVSGADKHMVGQVAADIKSYYPVEPYKAKGVTIVGDYVRRKEGKKAG